MNFNKIFYIFILSAFLFFTACQDVIDIDLAEGTPQLVVDAWLTDKVETQVIRLTRSTPYFDSSSSPVVTGATIILNNATKSTIFTFTDEDNDGNYTWLPDSENSIGEVGDRYILSIKVADQNYTATSQMNRVMPIDTITWEYREETLGEPEGVYAELFARDFVGVGDTYWIKTYKNGQFLNKPQEMLVIYDATATAEAGVDGIIIIPPIREAINRIPDTGDDAVDNDTIPPYAYGDSIYIEIHSLTPEAFYFLQEARIQMTLGDNGIFSPPPSNIPTNIETSATEPEDKALGFFCVSSVSSFGVRIEE